MPLLHVNPDTPGTIHDTTVNLSRSRPLLNAIGAVEYFHKIGLRAQIVATRIQLTAVIKNVRRRRFSFIDGFVPNRGFTYIDSC